MQKERGSSRILSLHKEIEREAREIEEEMQRHPELDDIQVTEEMDAALLKKIQDYEEELAEEREAVKKVEENLRRGRYLTAADGDTERAGNHNGADSAVRHFRVPGDSVEFAAELMPEFPRGFGLGRRDNRDAGDRTGETAAGCVGTMPEAAAGYVEKVEETIDGYGKSLKKIVAGSGGSVEETAAKEMAGVRADFVSEVGDAAEETAEDAGERKVLYRRKKRKYMLLSLAAVLVIVLGVGGTSVGSKSHWKVLWENLLGNETIQYIDSEDMDSRDTGDGVELTAYKEIKEKLNIRPVKIRYKPYEMELDHYEIQEEMLKAELLYKYKGEVVRYFLYMNDSDSSFGQNEEDNKIDEYTVSVNGIEIKVEEFKVADSSENRQIANFEYQGVHYQLKGVMEKLEFEKILKKLYFF